MKPLKSYFSVDNTIIAAALVALAVSAFFFMRDDQGFSNREELQPVGKFSTYRNDVRRRIETGLAWGTVSKNDVVYEGDSIFTGDDSETRIALDGGGYIVVAPKSLVVIRSKSRKLEVDLQYGSLQGKVAGEQGLLIKQGADSKEIQGQGAEIQLVREQLSNETRVQVLKGQVTVKPVARVANRSGSKAGKAPPPPTEASNFAPQVIKQDEVLQITSKAPPVVKKLDTTLVAPLSGKMIWLPTGENVKFEWKVSSGKPRPSRIEFAKDSKFADVTFKSDVSGTSFEMTDRDRPDGPFYWRVSPQNEAEALPTLPARLTVFPDTPPTPAFPSDRQVFTLNTDGGEAGKEVLLSWDDKAGSSSYKVQVAKDAEFQEIVLDRKATTPSERTLPLGVGEYHWRIKGEHPERASSPWSLVQTFVVKDGSKAPTAPVLTTDRIDYQIPRSVLSRTPASVISEGRGVKPDRVLPFTWSPVEDASSYEVELARSSDFQNAMKAESGANTFFSPPEVKPGVSYFRVRAKSRDGKSSPYSEAGKLVVQVPPPELAPLKGKSDKFQSEEEMKNAAADFNVSWEPVPYATEYELEWGDDPSFKRSKRIRQSTTSRQFNVVEPSTYAARVRAIASDGTPISEYSQAKLAPYEKAMLPPEILDAVLQKPKNPNLGALAGRALIPTLQEPRPQTSLISVSKSPVFVQFKWRGIATADSYTLQISSDSGFSKVLSEVKVRNNNFVFEKSLPKGAIYWRVRSNFKAKFSDWSAPYQLNVKYE